jgi:hypothetical protein
VAISLDCRVIIVLEFLGKQGQRTQQGRGKLDCLIPMALFAPRCASARQLWANDRQQPAYERSLLTIGGKKMFPNVDFCTPAASALRASRIDLRPRFRKTYSNRDLHTKTHAGHLIPQTCMRSAMALMLKLSLRTQSMARWANVRRTLLWLNEAHSTVPHEAVGRRMSWVRLSTDCNCNQPCANRHAGRLLQNKYHYPLQIAHAMSHVGSWETLFIISDSAKSSNPLTSPLLSDVLHQDLRVAIVDKRCVRPASAQHVCNKRRTIKYGASASLVHSNREFLDNIASLTEFDMCSYIALTRPPCSDIQAYSVQHLLLLLLLLKLLLSSW